MSRTSSCTHLETTTLAAQHSGGNRSRVYSHSHRKVPYLKRQVSIVFVLNDSRSISIQNDEELTSIGAERYLELSHEGSSFKETLSSEPTH